MKTVKLLLLGCSFASATISFSQTDKKDFLKNYKSPEFRMRQLTVGGGGYAGGSQNASNSVNSNYYQEWHEGRFGFGSSFKNVINSPKYQGYSSSALGLNFAYRLFNGTGYRALGLRASYSGENRFYLRPKLFFGFHNYTVVEPAYNTEIGPSDKYFKMRVNSTPEITLGLGRVEFAYFARQAMDIDRLLSKTGQLSQAFTPDQLKVLADRIGKLRNSRFLDSRLFRIKQLEMIDSTMSEFGIVNERDMSYFSRLNDAMFYANPFGRLSGFRAELGVNASPNYSILDPDNNEWSNHSKVLMKVDYYHPVSYAIQSDISFEGSYGHRVRKSGLLSTHEDVVSFSATYSFGWYPTTRTSLVLTGTGSYVNALNVSTATNASVSLKYYYYISPETRFNIRGGYSYRSSEFEDLPETNLFNESEIFSLRQGYSFSIGLNHAIF